MLHLDRAVCLTSRTPSPHAHPPTPTRIIGSRVIAGQGMIIVPLGYTNEHLSNMDEIMGGSPYGAGSISRADGKRDPSEMELDIGRTQGRRVAETAKYLVLGRRAAAGQ